MDGDNDGYGQGADCLGVDCDDDNAQCHSGLCCDPTAATCWDIYGCVVACGGDPACELACESYGDSVSQSLWDELSICFLSTGCEGADCQTLCAVELSACQSDT